MRPCPTVIATLFALVAFADDEVPGDLVENLIGEPLGADVQKVTPPIRDAVIRRLRRIVDGSDSEFGIKSGLHYGEEAKLILMRLGDEHEIESHCKMRDAHLTKSGEFSAGVIGFYVELSLPQLIPGLATYFSKEDGDNAWLHQEDERRDIVYPVSIGSAVSALGIMKGSPAFNPAVRKWAEDAFERVEYGQSKLDLVVPTPIPKADIDLKELRQSMREWWKENAPAFAAKDYASVKPGASPPVPKTPATAETAKDNSQPPALRTETPQATAPTSEPMPSPSASSPLIYPMAIGLSALLIAAIALLIQRKV